jgi:hypothetical protein
VGRLIGHQGEYGQVTTLSRQVGVSRQTLYAWQARGQRALAADCTPAPTSPGPGQERAILTFLVAGHASYRDIQECLAAVAAPVVSLGTISAVVQEAGQRALVLLSQPVGQYTTGIALDEIYGNDRHGGYLSVVDAHSGVVWGTAGPLGVDGDSWTLLLWLVQELGLRWGSTVHDGGKAMVELPRLGGSCSLLVKTQGEVPGTSQAVSPYVHTTLLVLPCYVVFIAARSRPSAPPDAHHIRHPHHHGRRDQRTDSRVSMLRAACPPSPQWLSA